MKEEMVKGPTTEARDLESWVTPDEVIRFINRTWDLHDYLVAFGSRECISPGGLYDLLEALGDTTGVVADCIHEMERNGHDYLGSGGFRKRYQDELVRIGELKEEIQDLRPQ